MKTERQNVNVAIAAWLLALALGASACASSSDVSGSDRSPPGNGSSNPSGSGKGGSSGSGGASGGSTPGNNTPGPGSGGSSSSGSGGSASGAGGFAGGADASASPPGADAGPAGGSGGGADAGAGDAAVEPPGCNIALYPVYPQRVIDVPAAEGAKMRIGALATGGAVPGKPVWRWTVTHAGTAVPHTAVDGEPAQIDFPTTMQGRYDVVAEIMGATYCTGGRDSVSAALPSKIVLSFLVRVTPPGGKNLPVIESEVYVQAGMPVVKTLEFQPFRQVEVKPHDETGVALPTYFVQLSSPSSTARFEAYVQNGLPVFTARPDPSRVYNLLIIPDGVGGAQRAPILYASLPAERIPNTDFAVDKGVEVTGTISMAGTPLPGSRVRLRDGLLPSTGGEARIAGVYALRTRSGRFEARVLPPGASGLPEAQVPRSAGIAIGPLGLGGPLNFVYEAVPMTKLTVSVTTAEGAAPSVPVDVVLESLDGQLSNVGKFVLPAGGEVVADGVVRQNRPTSAGAVVFEKIPRGRYRIIVNPPDNLPGESAITTLASVDLTGAAPVTMPVALGKRGRIAGRLLPVDKGAGLQVRAVDVGEDGVRRKDMLVTTNADGRFEFRTDPGRVYRLFVEPPPDRRVPRLVMDPVRATAATVTMEYNLPLRLSMSGTTVGTAGEPLGGAVIQVFCRGTAPVCVDREAADVSDTLPIDETVSGSDGRYQLWLPDPSQ